MKEQKRNRKEKEKISTAMLHACVESNQFTCACDSICMCIPACTDQFACDQPNRALLLG